MHRPTLTLSVRNAILIALGLTASTLAGASGCADRGGHEVCADPEIDYATCTHHLEAPEPGEPAVQIKEVCFDGSEGCDPCDAEAITAAAIEHADSLCAIHDLQRVTLLCGPDPEVEDCCYLVKLEGDLSCAGFPGRPLLAGAERGPRVAALRAGGAWLAGVDRFAGLCRPRDPDTVEVVRSHWLECARFEHASVAAFARVSLQLLALGAPAELLREAQRAMADEIRHAQLCFGLAAAYGGGPAREAGPLRVAGSAATRMDLEAALREAIVDGALGEGAAAIEALEGARSCQDPVVRDLLLRIAEDEQRHAVLAYRTVQWALAAHPRRAREIVRACLREGHGHAEAPAGEAGEGEDRGLGRYGLIAARRRAWIRRESWTGVVAPILAALLAEARPHPQRVA